MEARNNLGNVYNHMGRWDEAMHEYNKALELNPNHPVLLNNLGNAYQHTNNPDKALKVLDRAISIKPDYADAYNNLGNVLKNLDRSEDAISAYRHALNLNPAFEEPCYNLGLLLVERGDLDEARSLVTRAIKLNPACAEAHSAHGYILSKTNRVDDAIQAYRHAIEINPGLPDTHENLGRAFAITGRLEEARSCFRHAVDIDPDSGSVYRELSQVCTHEKYDDDMHLMELIYADNHTTSTQKMHTAFGLGKAFEDLGEYEKAFDYYLHGNNLKRLTFQYSIEKDESFFTRIKNTFTASFLESHGNNGSPDNTPVFIVGMPRSGTTLVEQILSSHPMTYGAGELGYMDDIVTQACRNLADDDYPECLPGLHDNAYRELGENYIRRLREHSSKARHITDKMPHNFIHIGMIKLILPNAKIIHCIRNPLDNCLSIYKNYFDGPLDYAYRMDELGEYYCQYAGLMAHWRSLVDDHIFDIRYEDLISDQLNTTRELLAFCRLDWDDACINFHRNTRNVHTASVAQVRRPIYQDSVDLWKRYGQQLEPLQTALGLTDHDD